MSSQSMYPLPRISAKDTKWSVVSQAASPGTLQFKSPVLWAGSSVDPPPRSSNEWLHKGGKGENLQKIYLILSSTASRRETVTVGILGKSWVSLGPQEGSHMKLIHFHRKFFVLLKLTEESIHCSGLVVQSQIKFCVGCTSKPAEWSEHRQQIDS